jgi:hypothetical protein
MKARLIVVALCSLIFMTHVAVAKNKRATRATAAPVAPPSFPLHDLIDISQPDGIIAHLLAFQPPIPLGPVDVLKAYEDGMTLIAQRLSADLISISQANIARQITRDEAEYLILERYQVAMMQHEVLSALHDSLEHDVAQTPIIRSARGRSSDTAVVVQPPSWSGQVRLQ